MKISTVSVTWPIMVSACLLCFGTFQACHTTPLGNVVIYWPEPVELHPPNANTDTQKKMAFDQALARHHGHVQPGAIFCVRKGENGRKCEPLGDRSVAGIVGKIKTEQVTAVDQLEAGGGPPVTPEAIHVAQRISFASSTEGATDAAAFLTDLGLPTDSGVQ